MAPRKKPKNLLELSFESVKSGIGCYVERNMKHIELPTQSGYDFDQKIQKFKDKVVNGQYEIDDYLQGTLRMRLLQLFLEDSGMMSKTRVGAFILLNSPNISSLAFGHFVQDWYYCLAKLVSTCSSGITQLSCRWLWLKDKSLELFIKCVPNMVYLRQLTVPYIATDELLSAVGRYCNQLEYLDLSGACGLSEDGAKSIYRYNVGGEYWHTELCNTLKFLYIGGPGGNRLASGCVAQLLVNLPNIISLGSYQQSALALERADRSKGGYRADYKFKLQYIHQNDITPKVYDIIIRCCPELKCMFLDTPSSEWIEDIMATPRMPNNLTKLKMNKVEGEVVIEMLKASQGSIRSLELVHCRGSLDISKVGQYCPYLTSLEVYYSERCIGTSELSLHNLHHLTKLVIYYTEVSGNLTESLLSICKELISVTVQSASTLTIQKLEDIYNDGGLDFIQEFALLSAPLLDYAALVFLIDYLPNINLIGKLEEWNLSQSEVILAKSYVKKENYDLVLWYNLPGYIELNIDEIM